MRTSKEAGKLGRMLVTAGMLSMLGAGMLEAAPDCPKPPNNNGGGTGDHNAQDPVFLLSEKKPVVSVKERRGQLDQRVSGRSTVTGEQEKAVLRSYEETREKDARQLYGKVLEMWGQEISPELKQYAILSSLPVVKSTDEVQTLRFMLSALEDVDARVKELTVLSKGNGLEKAKAARLLAILNRNPQFQM